MNTNRIIFNEFKQTINEEHHSFLGNMEDFKSKVKLMFGEDSLKVDMNDMVKNDIQMNIDHLRKSLEDDCDDIKPKKQVKSIENSKINLL
jgi:hypothetical protein